MQSAGRTYPAQDENFGYRIPRNDIRIPPGSTLKGFIGYAEFGNPAKIAALTKRRLSVVISPTVCE